MALQSDLFRGDPKLEAAAVSDPAHIVQGARGDHVRKIQLALIQLDDAAIVPDGTYGSATAAAVLTYKQKRNIVNHSYQTKADNIVGKMTMAALDREMLAEELKPVLIQPLDPTPHYPGFPRRGGLILAFGVNEPILPQVGETVVQLIKPLSATGRIQAFAGGRKTIVRTQQRNNFQVASILNGKVLDKDRDEIEVDGNGGIFSYQTLACGETFFRGAGGPSNVVQLLVLVDKPSARNPTNEDRSPDPNFKSGFVSKTGTPLDPLPGRRINLFGEGETPDFEDYSSDIDYCSHAFSQGATKGTGHRPWTADPRKPPGIDANSVPNIFCRGSPTSQVTIDEILRIGASKGRVTYTEARGHFMVDRLKAGLKQKGARVIEEGVHGTAGWTTRFELA
jgi:peptidoglycan hydrolase-like protein with peptidoglycan-binding domain